MKFHTKIASLVLTTILALSFMLTGCSSSKTQVSKNLVNGKFDPMITVTTCQYQQPLCVYRSGEGPENNIWHTAYKERYGINLKFEFTVMDYSVYNQRIISNLAANTLPDFMPIYTSLFFKTLDSGKLADLTDIYNELANDQVKEAMEFQNGFVRESASRDGKVYAIARPFSYGGDVLWIREDWRQKLNLPEPTSFEKLEKIVTAFTKNDPDGNGKNDTYGFAINKSCDQVSAFGNIFGARSIWVENENGELNRGETMENWVKPLKILNDWFKKGMIDSEFVSKVTQDMSRDFVANRLGLYLGSRYAPDDVLRAAFIANEEAEFKWYPVPGINEGDKVYFDTSTRVGNFNCVSNTCAYPEVAVILCNAYQEIMNDGGAKYYNDGELDTYWYPIVQFAKPDEREEAYRQCSTAIETGDTSKLGSIAQSYYNQSKPWFEKKDREGWAMYAIYGVDGSFKEIERITKEGLIYYEAGFCPETASWVQYGSQIASEITTYRMRAICGIDGTVEKSYEIFSDWYQNNGGPQCEQEMNDWWRAEGREKFAEMFGEQAPVSLV